MTGRTAYIADWRATCVFSMALLSFAGCSRDRDVQAAEGQKARPVKTEPAQIRDARRERADHVDPVSYTHLTLPTIYSV